MTCHRKKLIEVALPLEAINEESSLRKRKAPGGYPTTLHKWWAQRPLAACRAVIFASLVDDPDSDPTFRNADGRVDEERAGYRRAELFNLIEELVLWENSTNESVLNRARAEIAASIASRKILDTKEWAKDKAVSGEKAWAFVCRTAKPHNVNNFLTEHAPPVLDPFCGGGSIPLEAQRLGLQAYGSDLNPVPVLITKALIEIPPYFAGKPPVNSESSARFEDGWKGAQGLAEDVRYYGTLVRDRVEKETARLFPKITVTAEQAKNRSDLKPLVGKSVPVVAWLWARTVPSPDPSARGAEVPLVRSFALSSKADRRAWILPRVDKSKNEYAFEVGIGEPPAGFDPNKGTVSSKRLRGGRCILTDAPMDFSYIRAQAKAGKMGIRLMAIAVDAGRGRVYLSPTEEHAKAAKQAKVRWRPDCEFPKKHRNFQPPVYGLDNLGDIFTDRQLVVLDALAQAIRFVFNQVETDARAASIPDSRRYAEAVATYLAFALSRAADYNSTLSSWRPKDNAMRSTLAKQALPMVWDFAEGNPFAKSSAGFAECVNVVAKCLEFVPAKGFGQVRQMNATASVNDLRATVICTDPPYYDNIAYADLSDYLYVWLRQPLLDVYPDLFRTVLTPKAEELIASPHRYGGDHEMAKAFFETGLGNAFVRSRERQIAEYPMTVFYAFKQAETEDADTADDDNSDSPNTESVASTGWETMLEGLLRAGFEITGTWPMRTEGDNRQIGNDANALASSIVLCCRPRAADVALATRREFLNALKRELPDALKHLQRGNIAPVDLAQAAIGPGMAVFTRYSKVMEADGSSMSVRQALALINQMLDEVLAEQEGEFDPDTRWALAWFEQFAMEEGAFGIAETLSKAKNSAVNGLQYAGIIKARSGKVRLLKRNEMSATWDSLTNRRLTAWEVTQHLIFALDNGGENTAADLLRRLGSVGEIARDLAYRLYSICERKKWADEAMAYNSLVIAWPELSRLARSAPAAQPTRQTELF